MFPNNSDFRISVEKTFKKNKIVNKIFGKKFGTGGSVKQRIK